MNRRDTALALLALGGAPLLLHAQPQGKVWRVGFLGSGRRPDSLDSHFIGEFLRGMRELGYVEGKNLIIEWRFADGKAGRLPDLAAELVRLKPDVIVSGSSQGIGALQKATTTIPIVMATGGDPVGSGFVKSLARPGGNITGLTNQGTDIGAKQLELLLGIVPGLSRVAMLVNPVNPSLALVLKNVQSAAQRAGVTVLPFEVRTTEEIESAFLAIVQANAKAVIVPTDSIFLDQYPRIAGLAAKHRLPSVSQIGDYVDAGGLVSYGPSLRELFRHAAIYVDKIFRGAKPGDLPVEQPTTFAMHINARTAKALGITIPQSIILRADRVLE